MSFLQRWLKASRVFNFNQVERDKWIKQQASKVETGSKVLDMGAGSAPYSRFFSHCVYHTQDFAQLKPEQLRGHVGYEKLTYECDITQVPVPDATYDVILCTEVMEHVPEPIKVVREMRRILKPGGKVIITAPLGSGIHQEPYHYYGGYTPYWYNKFLCEAGFDNVTIEPNGGFFRHYGQESIRLLRMLAPPRITQNRLAQLAWAPLWLLMVPWFAVVCPIACFFADSLDRNKDFTIGYHVCAEKSLVA